MSTATIEVRDELDRKFQTLDDESKLMVALMAFSQCTYGHRRFLDLGQMRHAYDYITSEDALRTAAAVQPSVVDQVEEIRGCLETISENPPPYHDKQLNPVGDTSSREFLWADSFEEPVWFELRHAARKGLTDLEAVLAPKPGPPPGAAADQ